MDLLLSLTVWMAKLGACHNCIILYPHHTALLLDACHAEVLVYKNRKCQSICIYSSYKCAVDYSGELDPPYFAYAQKFLFLFLFVHEQSKKGLARQTSCWWAQWLAICNVLSDVNGCLWWSPWINLTMMTITVVETATQTAKLLQTKQQKQRLLCILNCLHVQH